MKTKFYPKRIVKSFRDLDVYQKTFSNSVEVMKKIVPEVKDSPLRDRIIESGLSIPNLIAEAHSHRFDDFKKACDLMDESMAECNKVVVYLEQARDIHNTDKIITEEIIKNYINTRWKILNLQRAWKKFQEKYEEKRGMKQE
ncbi:MAG: four helix bundle protein [Candidatus Aenigmarchaeota archaeon]|nr:four helix bundle protein [Candidatus Aenigmarchaeota archaeon]